MKRVHGSSEYDFRTQTCIFYQVIDDFLGIGSQRIVVKGTGGHLFHYREFPYKDQACSVNKELYNFFCIAQQFWEKIFTDVSQS